MKLTSNQILILDNLNEDGCWEDRNSSGGEKRTLQSLERLGLVGSVEYANGKHWLLTDSGMTYLREL